MTNGRACERCGALADTRQEYCLECGERFAAPRRSTHWLWPTVAAGLVAAAASAVAVAAGADDSGHSTIVALTPLRPAPSPTRPAGQTLVRWPRRDGYTIVLTEIPTAAGEAAADARARRAVRAGLSDVGVLASADFTSLHPGYYLVFSGVYGGLDEALAALPHARARFRSAYAQQIAR